MSEQVKKILLFTGNMIDNHELIRKVKKSTLEELHACVKSTLNNWKQVESTRTEVLQIHGAECRIKANLVANKPCNGLTTTVKIFLSRNSGKDVLDAVLTVKNSLELKLLENVIVVPPDVSEALSLEELQPIWMALESSVANGDVQNLGVADLTPDLFKQLYEWAEVKPSIIQLNMASCCAVSEDLVAFTSQRDLQVLTHSDDAEVVDEDLVGTILSRAGLAGADYGVTWLARHRTIQTCYGLVASKGYTLALHAAPEES